MQINPIKAVKNLFQIFIRLHRCTHVHLSCVKKIGRQMQKFGLSAQWFSDANRELDQAKRGFRLAKLGGWCIRPSRWR